MRSRVMMLALAGALAAGAARADVTYTASVLGQGGSNPFQISLDLTDAQVASGSFNLYASGSGSYLPTFRGDTDGFVSAMFDGERVTHSYVYGTLTAALTFDPASDAITAITLHFLGISAGADISGTGSAASVRFGDDGYKTCGYGYQPCTITTAFATTISPSNPVPEPAAFAVLGAGLLGMVGLRRQFSSGEA